MLKKITCLVLSFLFICQPLCFGFYDIDSIPISNNATNENVLPIIESKIELQLDSESVILIDENTGTILYAKNEHEKLRPASVTKVMTLLLIMEALGEGEIQLTDKVPCSDTARKMGGSQIWLNETETLTVDEMLKAICIVSANDCTVAMAEFIAGSEEAFVAMMNEKAKLLKMNDTTFKNSHGIDEDGHLTSSYDIAIMSRELSKKHPKIHEYTKIWMDTLREGKSQLVNTNKLIRFYSGATGLKTGSTSLALYNLSATASRNNLNLIAVVMKGSTSQKRFDDAKRLLDYGFATFSSTQIVEQGEIVTKISIPKSKEKEIEIIAGESKSILTSKDKKQDLTKEIEIIEKIILPLEEKAEIGKMKCYINNELIEEVQLLTKMKIEKKDLGDFINNTLDIWYTQGRTT